MKFAASIRILFVLILALGFIDQHNGCMSSSSLAKQEMAGHSADSGSFCSQVLIDFQHGDDILSEIHPMLFTPEFVLKETVCFPVPAPAIAGPSPAWQPPELRS